MNTIKYIKNPPTTQDLKSLYQSPMYQELLKEFSHQMKEKIADDSEYFHILEKNFLHLNMPFEEVVKEFEKNKEKILAFTMTSTRFFMENDDCPDGEFPEWEELGEENASVTEEELGFSSTVLLDKFCEFQLLHLNDKDHLAYYLKATRMPYAKKYQWQITKIYKQIMR